MSSKTATTPDKPTGMFWMQTPRALFNKMVKDANQLAQDHLDSHVCFNFFVTAEHLPDWLLPGNANNAERNKLKDEPILRVCSQIANGGKHFVTEAKKHTAIKSTAYMFSVTLDPAGRTQLRNKPDPEPENEFVIHLNAPEANALGCESMTVRQLAKRVLDFWEPKVKNLPMF
jgi:hypothetical protein